MDSLDNFKDTKRQLKKNMTTLEDLLEKIESISDF